LRYYEDEGLIVPGRHSNGYRDYCQPTVDTIQEIRELLDAGLPVRLIREALPHVGEDTGPTWQEFLDHVAAYRERLVERIDELATQKSALDAFLQRARVPRVSA
jgi:DNA-binding transcriptional MerR regulator